MGSAAQPDVPGRPLLALTLVLGGWIALRVLLWNLSLSDVLPQPVFAPAPADADSGPQVLATASETAAGLTSHAHVPSRLGALVTRMPPQSRVPTDVASKLFAPAVAAAPLESQAGLAAPVAFAPLAPPPPLGPRLLGAEASPPSPVPVPRPPQPEPARWSGDGWLLWRGDSGAPLAAGQPSYGRSQVGAVLRYALAPSSGHRPAAYARAVRAIDSPRETEFAGGLSARPVPSVPLRLAAELRVTDGPGGTEVRPAAFVVTELPAASLPLGLRAEAYAQAGYVAGHFATAFVDGQVRVDAAVVRLASGAELRVGAGLWGGAQKDAARLDVGPGATAGFRLGPVQARVAFDYRLRVAGDAAPGSGPALTISAGF